MLTVTLKTPQKICIFKPAPGGMSFLIFFFKAKNVEKLKKIFDSSFAQVINHFAHFGGLKKCFNFEFSLWPVFLK